MRPYIASTLSFDGCRPSPQLPTTSVVMPWSTLAPAAGSTGSEKSPCEWTSMKPGATKSPVASSTSSGFSVVIADFGDAVVLQEQVALACGCPRSVEEHRAGDEDTPGHAEAL